MSFRGAPGRSYELSFELAPCHRIGGIVVFGRIQHKIGLFAKDGKRAAGYRRGMLKGNRTLDERVCEFPRVSYEELEQRTLQGGTEEDVLKGCFS